MKIYRLFLLLVLALTVLTSKTSNAQFSNNPGTNLLILDELSKKTPTPTATPIPASKITNGEASHAPVVPASKRPSTLEIAFACVMSVFVLFVMGVAFVDAFAKKR